MPSWFRLYHSWTSCVQFYLETYPLQFSSSRNVWGSTYNISCVNIRFNPWRSNKNFPSCASFAQALKAPYEAWIGLAISCSVMQIILALEPQIEIWLLPLKQLKVTGIGNSSQEMLQWHHKNALFSSIIIECFQTQMKAFKTMSAELRRDLASQSYHTVVLMILSLGVL